MSFYFAIDDDNFLFFFFLSSEKTTNWWTCNVEGVQAVAETTDRWKLCFQLRYRVARCFHQAVDGGKVHWQARLSSVTLTKRISVQACSRLPLRSASLVACSLMSQTGEILSIGGVLALAATDSLDGEALRVIIQLGLDINTPWIVDGASCSLGGALLALAWRVSALLSWRVISCSYEHTNAGCTISFPFSPPTES